MRHDVFLVIREQIQHLYCACGCHPNQETFVALVFIRYVLLIFQLNNCASLIQIISEFENTPILDDYIDKMQFTNINLSDVIPSKIYPWPDTFN